MTSLTFAVSLVADPKVLTGVFLLAVAIGVCVWIGTAQFQALGQEFGVSGGPTTRGRKSWGRAGDSAADGKPNSEVDDLADISDRETVLTQLRSKVVSETSRRVNARESGRELQRSLEVSGSNLRSAEWLIIVAATTVTIAFVLLLWRGPIAALPTLLLVPMLARIILRRNIGRRQNAFAKQLPDILQLISSGLRAGQSLPQAIAGMAPEIASPGSEELRRVIIENRIGRDLTDSFRDLAERMGSLDFEWVVSAIHINRSVGGDLSKILRRLEATIRARNRVAGQVKALSAEGRISGLILTMLPPAMMLAIQVINPGFMDVMFTTKIGKFLLILSGVMLTVGGFWLSRMAKFKF